MHTIMTKTETKCWNCHNLVSEPGTCAACSKRFEERSLQTYIRRTEFKKKRARFLKYGTTRNVQIGRPKWTLWHFPKPGLE